MNFKSQAQKLSELIQLTSPIWRDEIMNTYPESLEHYPSDWLSLLDSLSEEELFAVDSKIIIEKIKGSGLVDLMQTVLELTEISEIESIPEIPLEDWAFNGIKKKKRHEIQKIAPVLKTVQAKTQFEYVVDIGGGVGHLSRVLSHYHGIPSISLDRDREFQKIGIERLKKYRRIYGAAEVEFVNLNFGENNNNELMEKVFKKNSLTLGLHTCGELSNILIQNTVDYKTTGLLNFGCCYHRMNPKTDFPMSQFYRDQNYPKFNLYGLTLATRAHSPMTFEAYKTKERVKSYRYALHLFLLKTYNNKHFTEVGECNIKIYWEPFAGYIREKLVELKIDHQFSDEDFNQFYQSAEIQRELRTMYLCNIIRWQIGRALEVYLLIDRCLFLEEQGYEVKLEQYFTEGLSPRNLGILAIKN